MSALYESLGGLRSQEHLKPCVMTQLSLYDYVRNIGSFMTFVGSPCKKLKRY